MHWIFAAATVPQARGEEIFYEPMPEWITGMAASRSRPDRTARGNPHAHRGTQL